MDDVRVEIDGKMLIITVSGYRDNFAQVVEGSRRIVELARDHGCHSIIADYNNVTFNLNLSEAFNLIRLYEHSLPDFKDYHLAAVINEQSKEIAGFWESIGKKRNFNIKTFGTVRAAREWLMAIAHNTPTR